MLLRVGDHGRTCLSEVGLLVEVVNIDSFRCSPDPLQ